MSIGGAVAAALPFMRANAQSLMGSRCTIERETGADWDEAAQATVTTWVVVHADVPCHIEEPSVTSRSTQTEESVTLEAPLVHTAHTVTGVLPDDRVTVAGREPMWVTRAALDDFTHPVEMLIQCRWSR